MNNTSSGKVINFKRREILHPTRSNASFIDIIIQHIRELLGRGLRKMKIPGAVSNIQYNDDLTGQEIEIHVGTLFTRISVNGRDYFFHRATGKFDGTGIGCS